ncbi:MAG: hypothetical protein LBR61_03680 [Synergistaceae bacterium]|jgi:hypothetical protein|nr:hypothetical protein [Synergistaceae bacterium]
MKRKFYEKKKAFVLFPVVALLFAATLLLGLFLFLTGRSLEVAKGALERTRTRSAFLSMTNDSLRWLNRELKEHRRPRASFDGPLSDLNFLRVFASGDSNFQSVTVYDLDYPWEKLESSPALPPPCTGGYLIRAVVARKGEVPFISESVFKVLPIPSTNETTDYVLEERPFIWREIRR